jgi:hypothetical protein
MVAVALIETTLDRQSDEPTHPVVSPALKAAIGVVLAAVAIGGPPLGTATAFAIAIIALAIPAAYGATVYYRQTGTVPEATVPERSVPDGALPDSVAEPGDDGHR